MSVSHAGSGRGSSSAVAFALLRRAAERIVADLAPGAGAAGPADPGMPGRLAGARRRRGTTRLRVMAIGWATVELERAERELAGTLAIGSRGAFRSGLADGILGAACRMVRPDPGGPWLVLLEPTTEGRLAATLARSGEGVAAVYVARAPGDEGASAVEPGLPGLPSPASGPFGVSRLLAGGRHGPYLILVEPGPDLE